MLQSFVVQFILIFFAGLALDILYRHFMPVFNDNFIHYRVRWLGLWGGIVKEFGRAAVAIIVAVVMLILVFWALVQLAKPPDNYTDDFTQVRQAIEQNTQAINNLTIEMKELKEWLQNNK
ncbi:MAG: hypothetical protein HW414_1476 [Dehalococcoidia bacterium]|nr:hypothetical protein [Dehalococcoidia bacterium]